MVFEFKYTSFLLILHSLSDFTFKISIIKSFSIKKKKNNNMINQDYSQQIVGFFF